MSQGVSKCRPELSAWVKLFLSTVEASSIHTRTRAHTLQRDTINMGVPVSDTRLRRPSGRTSKTCPTVFARTRERPPCHTRTPIRAHASIQCCKWAVASLALFTVAEWSKPGSIALKRRTLERFVLQNLDTHTQVLICSHTHWFLVVGISQALDQKAGTGEGLPPSQKPPDKHTHTYTLPLVFLHTQCISKCCKYIFNSFKMRFDDDKVQR